MWKTFKNKLLHVQLSNCLLKECFYSHKLIAQSVKIFYLFLDAKTLIIF